VTASTALTMSNTRSWKAFAELINTSWSKGAEAFIDTGRYLLEAKAELDRDLFESLVKRHLAFDTSTGRKLMRIAGDQIICANWHKLPPRWTTIYDLSKLDDETLKAGFADGTIHPGMRHKDMAALRRKDKDTSAEQTATSTPPSAYDILLAAWKSALESWKSAPEPDRCRLAKEYRAEITAALGVEFLAELQESFEQQLDQRDFKNDHSDEINTLARDCSALLTHAEQNRDDIRRKLAQIRSLTSAKGKARRQAKSNVRLDRGALARGLGLAGPPGKTIPTMTLVPSTDASGNTIHTLPRA
jgi:hypothetical protein